MRYSLPEQNTICTIKHFLRLNNVYVSEESLADVLIKHPDYPSMACFNMTLRFFGIQSVITRLEPNQVPKVQLPIIAHIDDFEGTNFVVITEIKSDKVVYYKNGDKRDVSFYEFLRKWNGVALINTWDSHKKKPGNYFVRLGSNFSGSNIKILLAWVTALFILFFRGESLYKYLEVSVYVLSSAGLLLLYHYVKEHFGVWRYFYGVPDINYLKWKDYIFDISYRDNTYYFTWLDLYSTYFITSILSLFLSDVKISTVGSLVIPVCTVCVFQLMVILVKRISITLFNVMLWLLIGLQIFLVTRVDSLYNEFNITSFPIVLLGFTIWMVAYYGIQRYHFYKTKSSLLRKSLSNISYLLSPEDDIVIDEIFERNSDIIIGNKKADVAVHFIMSPFENIDRRVYTKLKELTSRFDNFNVKIVPISFDSKNKVIHEKLISLLSLDNEESLVFQLETLISEVNTSPTIYKDIIRDIGVKQIQQTFDGINQLGIYKTPALFINNFLLDEHFDCEDIPFVCEVLSELNLRGVSKGL